jgi:hypothetical protein
MGSGLKYSLFVGSGLKYSIFLFVKDKRKTFVPLLQSMIKGYFINTRKSETVQFHTFLRSMVTSQIRQSQINIRSNTRAGLMVA